MTFEEEKRLHEERCLKACRCEQPDRTPFIVDANIAAKFADPDYAAGDNYLRPEWVMDRILEGIKKIGCDNLPAFEYFPSMNVIFNDGTRYITPGKESPRTSPAQTVEHNLMDSPEYYDYIIENGWMSYVENYVNIHKTEDDYAEFDKYMGLCEVYAQKVIDQKVPQFDFYASSAMVESGYYHLSLLRGFGTYLKDLRRYGDKVLKVTKMIDDCIMEDWKAMQPDGPAQFSFTGSLTRVDNNAMSHKMFEKFVWPVVKRYDEACGPDQIQVMHVDGNYADDIDLFTQLRPGRTVIQHDGFTDPEAVADAYVKNKICFWGDVPPQMMTLGKPEEVYNHCMKLKKLFGPGLILAAGCMYPPDTPMENMLALKEAAENMHF